MTTPRITSAHVIAAADRLRQYRIGKQRLDARIYHEKMWWRDRFGRDSQSYHPQTPTSAWLFNSISHKHADLCDNYPTCRILPREESDQASAQMLSDVIPVILKNCQFDQTYNLNAWSKLKHGMAAYGIFWDPTLASGLGDIAIRRVDILNLFWAPDVSHLQESPHLYLVSLEDTETLVERYHLTPEVSRQLETSGALPETGGSYFGTSTTYGDKTAVVDWYYKALNSEGREVVHFAKFTGNTLLYASENDPLYAEDGWYNHGKYPFVLDVLYPEEGTPEGFGLLAVGKNPQNYIDQLDGHLLTYANWASRVRFWAKKSLGVNPDNFLDLDNPIVEVEGDIDEEKLRQITLAPMDSGLSGLRQMKVEELKETTGVRDVSLGGTSGGVTSAAAITALQEAGSKTSRDCIAGTYAAFVEMVCQVIELVRQFYDGRRTFRITGKDNNYRFVRYSNQHLGQRTLGMGADGQPRYYLPIFDIDVSAECQNPSDRLGRNELMLKLYESGMLSEGQERAALRALSGMDFDGIATLRSTIEQHLNHHNNT